MRDDKPKGDATPLPTEAELSRIAREAVHQPADARLDRQLVRMGVIDAPEPEPRPAPPTPGPVSVDPELLHLREQVRRVRRLMWLLVGVIVILAVVIVGLLIR